MNRSGGLLGRPVELICHDDGTDASRVERLYRRLLDDQHVDLIVGGYGTNTLRPTRPLGRRHIEPTVAPFVSSDA